MVRQASICALLVGLVSVPGAAAVVTATWDGGGDGINYSDPNNWDVGQVPIDNVTDQFEVVIPAGFAVTYDVAGASDVTGLSLAASSSTLSMASGTALTVLNDAAMSGLLTAADADFDTTDAGAALTGTRARLRAVNGGTIAVNDTTYVATGHGTTSLTLLESDGAGSSIDLSSVDTIDVGFSLFGGTQVHTIRASDTGQIDLSGVTTIIAPDRQGDRVDFVVETGGDIDLGGLQNSNFGTGNNGRVRFDINLPTFTLPALTTADWTDFYVEAGQTVNVPVLATMRRGIVDLDGGGVLTAPALTNIDGNRFFARGGSTFTLPAGATSFSNVSLDSGTQLLADGSGSLLDMSALLSYTDTRNVGGTPTRTVSAINDGTIDLSNVGTITGPNDFLKFSVTSGGEIKFDNVTTVTGGNVIFDIGNGDSFDMPALDSMFRGRIEFDGANPGTFDAPLLDSFQWSRVTLGGAGQSFNAPAVTNVDRSQFLLSNGTTYTLPSGVTTYSSVGRNESFTMFSASGTGTSLDLSALTKIDAFIDVFGGTQVHTIQATSDGAIDLSGVTEIVGPRLSVDRLDLVTSTNGSINLSSLQEINPAFDPNTDTVGFSGGTVRFATDHALLELPTLTTARRTEFLAGAGQTVEVTGLADFRYSRASLSDGGQLTTGALANIDHSQFHLSGGSTYQLDSAVTTYYSGDRRETYTLFSADGAGTLLDLNELGSINAQDSNPFFGGTQVHSIEATNDGTVDLAELATLTGLRTAGDRFDFVANTNGRLDLSSLTSMTSINGGIKFDVASGGEVQVGALVSSSLLTVAVDGAGSKIEVTGDVDLPAIGSLSVTDGLIQVGGNFVSHIVDPAMFDFDSGVLVMNGVGSVQTLEIGSVDLGDFSAGAPTSGNFGYGSLKIGTSGGGTTVELDNTFAGGSALYLNGASNATYTLEIGVNETMDTNGFKLYFNGDVHLDGTLIAAASVGADALINDGNFSGRGTLEGDLVNDDTVEPSFWGDPLEIDGEFTTNLGSTLAVDIGANSIPKVTDQLVVTGAASFEGGSAGTLDVNLFGTPTPGDTFEVMTFASTNGEFATHTGTGLIDPNTALVPVYSATALTLVTAIAGDVNLDGVVNGLDANTVSANFLSPGGYAQGDANFDGVVNGLDANIISAHFLQMNPATAIPEPGSALLMALGVVMGVARRRWR